MAHNPLLLGIPRVPVKVNERPPTIQELYRTLRICLQYVEDGCNIFSRLISALEAINFSSFLRDNRLNEPEMRRLLPMLGQRLTSLRIQLADISTLFNACRTFRVRCLGGVKNCIILSGREGQNKFAILMLGRLIPNVQMLHIFAPIDSRFPMLRHLRTVYVGGKISQEALDDLFTYSPMLENFVLRDGYPDIKKIGRCRLLKETILPLQLRSAPAIYHLENLTHLSMVRQKLWPGMDWLPTVLAIIHAKRHQIQRLTFDGSWLVRPLNFARLKLNDCTALDEVRFSNCKLKDVTVPPLPLCCKNIAFRRCTLGKLNSFLRFHPLVREIQIINSQLQWDVPVLNRLLALRKFQPVQEPLLITFCQSTKLRSEYTKWRREDMDAAKPFLQVKEIDPHHVKPWKIQAGMISMTFGRPVNYAPEIRPLGEDDPTAADVLLDLR
ncbi:uncharacterized protein Dana_GF18925 [Drosophila ananassae]|uniref:F-box domain-containing protein n=1 Tax=Drosophila ananassae TaxID=7217 RepID=B3M162_DROAN|nr:uncharacterized protein LOC6501690 [Drosophila ananassae]EDV44332.1 uncharacterized protein Dana_GF18925 [Drosophila ananassae]